MILDIFSELQKPHPPLRQTCTSPESFEMAGELGVGALGTTLPVVRLLNRQLAGHRLDPEEVYEVLDALDSMVIGDPARCLEKMLRFKAVGTDRLMCFMQFGALAPARILESVRRTGELLLPAVRRS